MIHRNMNFFRWLFIRANTLVALEKPSQRNTAKYFSCEEIIYLNTSSILNTDIARVAMESRILALSDVCLVEEHPLI